MGRGCSSCAAELGAVHCVRLAGTKRPAHRGRPFYQIRPARCLGADRLRCTTATCTATEAGDEATVTATVIITATATATATAAAAAGYPAGPGGPTDTAATAAAACAATRANLRAASAGGITCRRLRATTRRDRRLNLIGVIWIGLLDSCCCLTQAGTYGGLLGWVGIRQGASDRREVCRVCRECLDHRRKVGRIHRGVLGEELRGIG